MRGDFDGFDVFSRLIKPQDLSAKEMANWNRWIPCCFALILFSLFHPSPLSRRPTPQILGNSAHAHPTLTSLFGDYRSIMERARNKELSEKISSQIVSDQRLLDQFGKPYGQTMEESYGEKISPQLAPEVRQGNLV